LISRHGSVPSVSADAPQLHLLVHLPSRAQKQTIVMLAQVSTQNGLLKSLVQAFVHLTPLLRMALHRSTGRPSCSSPSAAAASSATSPAPCHPLHSQGLCAYHSPIWSFHPNPQLQVNYH